MSYFDKDLIYLYSENARAKIKDYAKLLKKSEQRLKYSLKVLDREKIVYNPHCVFDYSYFGVILFRVYFKGGYITEKDKVNILLKLQENPYVISIYELEGEFDLVIEMGCPNISRFNKELKIISDELATLSNYKIVLNIVTHAYPKDYILKSKNISHSTEDEIIVGGDRAVMNFNEKEMSVMKCLLKKPMTRMTNLAESSGMNVKTAVSIIKKLKEKKVLKGFKQLVNINALKISKARLLLKLHNLNIKTEKSLIDYIKKTSEIIQINKTLGDWNAEIDIESFDKTKIRAIVLEIREQFRDIIENFNMIEYYHTYTKSYLPRYLFDS